MYDIFLIITQCAWGGKLDDILTLSVCFDLKRKFKAQIKKGPLTFETKLFKLMIMNYEFISKQGNVHNATIIDISSFTLLYPYPFHIIPVCVLHEALWGRSKHLVSYYKENEKFGVLLKNLFDFMRQI